jgi:hypothetical protein
MIAVCFIVAITIVLAVLHLTKTEYARFKLDPSPGPPLAPEKASLETWHARVALTIAGLSVLGALLVWQASTSFGNAGGFNQQVLQDTTQYQTVLAIQNSRIDFGQRLTLLYQEHDFTETQLYKKALFYRGTGATDDARQLEAEARVEGAEERALDPGFLYYSPTSKSSGAQVFNESEEEQVAREENRDLITLSPSHVAVIEAQADSDRSEGQDLVLATAFFVSAVFFLTVANLSWRHRRLRTLMPGLLASIVGTIILTLVAI